MAIITKVGDFRKLTENLPDDADVMVVFDVGTGKSPEPAQGFVLAGAVDTVYADEQGTDVFTVSLEVHEPLV